MAEKDDSFLGGKEAGLPIGFSRDTIEKGATRSGGRTGSFQNPVHAGGSRQRRQASSPVFQAGCSSVFPQSRWSKYSSGLVLSGLAAGQGRGLWRLLGTISGRTQACLFNKRRQLTPDGFRREIVLKKCSLTLNGVQKVVSSNLTAPTIFHWHFAQPLSSKRVLMRVLSLSRLRTATGMAIGHPAAHPPKRLILCLLQKYSYSMIGLLRPICRGFIQSGNSQCTGCLWLESAVRKAQRMKTRGPDYLKS